jgi:hypothetical protein
VYLPQRELLLSTWLHGQFAPLLWALIKAEKKVIDEDAVALEQLQKKLHLDSDRCQHGIYEAHIVRMMRWYANAMSM